MLYILLTIKKSIALFLRLVNIRLCHWLYFSLGWREGSIEIRVWPHLVLGID